MSVYKRKGSDTYSYDFKLQNRRFSGDTRATTKREAQRIEADRKDAARLEIAQEAAFYADRMTFEIAASRWFLEVGQHAKDVETVLRNLDWLKTHIGATTGLEAITDSVVAGLVARRRGETARNRKTPQLVSNATVNRTCTQPLREIIMRAKKTLEGGRWRDRLWQAHAQRAARARARSIRRRGGGNPIGAATRL